MNAVNHCTITPVRQEPSERSEQVTQLLFGEPCEVLERLPRWTKVRAIHDGQEGWVDSKMLTELHAEHPIQPTGNEAVVALPMAIATDMETGDERMLTLGTGLPNYAHGTFEVLNRKYLIDPATVVIPQQAHALSPANIALSLLNTPYLWGGKNAMGMDCSGFTQVVYTVLGVRLLRNASEQITQGVPVPSLAEAQPGDLAFFDHADRDPEATNISHVGLLLDAEHIIHCSGCVHVDAIDETGIRLPNGERTHHLVQIKRYR